MLQIQADCLCSHSSYTIPGCGPLSAYVDSVFLTYKVGMTAVPTLYDCVGIKCVVGTVSML